MDVNTAQLIIKDDTLSESDISILLKKAQRLAVNQHFWAPDDVPTEEQLTAFYERYEFEIYDIAKAINSDDARDGLKSFTELGVQRTWGKTGKETIDSAISAIPPKTYIS